MQTPQIKIAISPYILYGVFLGIVISSLALLILLGTTVGAQLSFSRPTPAYQLATYSANSITDSSKKHVLFFNADWCGFCRSTLKSMQTGALPNDVVFYDIDIDDQSNSELVKKYRVVAYPTFVQIDKDQNEVIRSEGGDTISNVLSKLGY